MTVAAPRLRCRQRAEKVAKVVGKCMKLEPHYIGRERPARQARPIDRSLAFLDPLFARAALVVERDDPLGGAALVGDDESDARNKLASVPLDLGDHPARLGPASRLIAEVGVVPPNIVRRATDWALEQVADPVLEDLIGWNTDRILDPLGFEILVDPGMAKASSARK